MKRKTPELIVLILFASLGLLSLSVTGLAITDSAPEARFTQFFVQAEKSRLEGFYEDSLKFFMKSLSAARDTEDKAKEVETLLKLGLIQWNIGSLEESKRSYEEAYALAEKFGLSRFLKDTETALTIHEYYTLGKKYRANGNYQKSIDSFRKAIQAAKKSESKEHEVKCLRQLSLTHWELNDLNIFYELNKEALKLSQELSHKKEEQRCLINIGLYFQKIDQYDKALDYYDNGILLAKIIKSPIEEAACLNNIGNIYRAIGDYDKSLEYLFQALKIDQQLQNDYFIAMDHNNLGATYRLKGLHTGQDDNYQNALKHYNKSLRLANKIGDNKTQIKVLNNIGGVYSLISDDSQALDFFQNALEKAEKIQDIEAMGMILNNMGIVYSSQGNYAGSTKYYQRAIDLAQSINDGQILWEAYLEIANAYAKQDQTQSALINYEHAIRIIEDIRSQINLEELKASFLGTDKRLDAYHNLINLLINLHEVEPQARYDAQAFHYMERARGRAFLDSLELAQVNISRGVDPELLNKEKKLLKDFSVLYTKLISTDLASEQYEKIKQDLTNLENDWESYKRQIRAESPAYANLRFPEIISLENAQNLIDGQTAFFTYTLGKEASHAFVVTKKTIKIFPLPHKKELQTSVSAYLQAISDRETLDFESGVRLFKTLILPGLTDEIKNIIFIPDDILHYIPFEALIHDERNMIWLIEDYSISYAPSISSLNEIIANKRTNKTKKPKDLLAFGDPEYAILGREDFRHEAYQSLFAGSSFNLEPLRFSAEEVHRIGSLFKTQKKQAYLQGQASEERLKALNLEDYKIIHFATHSLINEQKPSRSSIILSLDDDPTEDGFLQMREIYNLRLNADLVTLSACQTGLGQLIKGEGIEGLNRAFFAAGSSSVLMSLWPVNDQVTSQFMERFYAHLNSSETITAALRKTKLEMIRSSAVSHPFYWAAFIASGKTNQPIFRNSQRKWLLLSASLLIFGGLVALKITRFSARKP